MKKTILMSLLFITSAITASAQEFSTRYGKVTKDELTMNSYSKDTTATAVVLYKNVEARYDYRNGKFEIEYYYETKIKILKAEGKEYADVNIPFYNTGKSGDTKETVSRIEAFAYNLEDGKINKTKMEKSYIFEEQLNAKLKQIKFSIPSVKAGTVIEYKYNITSELYWQFADMIIQQSIPVMYAKYEVQIPEYFNYNIETRGGDYLKTEEKSANQNFTVMGDDHQTSSVNCSARQLAFTVNDLPALKDEPNVWCAEDFCTKVTFELKGIQFPYSIYQSYTTDWDKINELLKNENDFGGLLKLKNPFKEEMNAINMKDLSTQDKIRSIYQLLKKKISWNENYHFFGSNIKKAIKEGSGSNADINFILISMLKDAGINAFPIMMSTRDQGRLPLTYPSINKLNTFIVGINDTDSTVVFLDGSVKNGDINILPPKLMVDRARIYNVNGKGDWIDLTNVGKNSVNTLIKGSITPEGKVEGEKITYYFGEYAEQIRTSFKAAKDSTTYIEKKETEDAIAVKGFSFKNLNNFSSSVQENLAFNKEAIFNDEHIYLNPMIFPHLTKNQFTSETRKLPIEFGYPQKFKLTCVLDIPEGYQVEELPKSVKINLDKDGCSCTYNIKVLDNKIQLLYIFSLTRILYSKEEYETLRNFWGTIVDKNNEQIVLKKADPQNAANQTQTSQL
jgi:hypothetical protein